MLSCDLDIIGIAETHLLNDSAPTLDGYSAFSHNRTQIHKRAKVGSGGVSLFFKNEIVESYNISILDNSIEDILWVRLEHKNINICVNICVCYLPPDGSSRQVDPYVVVVVDGFVLIVFNTGARIITHAPSSRSIRFL